MGKTIESLLGQDDQITLKISSNNKLDTSNLSSSNIDVAIDFSTPETAVDHITACIEAGIPIVSGTTGWLAKWDKVTELTKAKNGAFFYAPNFSLGVNLFFAINKYAAELFARHKQYAVNIEEIHHTEKKDAPSGTAIRLAEGILEHYPDLHDWSLEETQNTIHIDAQRIPNVPGTHIMRYRSDEDQISLSHVAHTRESFAKGAIAAARWIIGKKGVFGMQDMLEL